MGCWYSSLFLSSCVCFHCLAWSTQSSSPQSQECCIHLARRRCPGGGAEVGKCFPPFRSCVPSPQPPAWGVFGLVSERKASLRSDTGAGEASRAQAGRRTPLPTRSRAALPLGSPAPGVFFCPRPSFSSGPFCCAKQRRKALSVLPLWGRHRVSQETGPGRALAWGRLQTRAVMTGLGWARVSVPGSSA